MTIEEKLERLTERHEALAQSLELLKDSIHEQGDNIEKQGRNIDRLIALAETQTPHIEALFKIVDSHERRIRRIEGEAS